MSHNTREAQWSTYSEAWGPVTPEERSKLLAQSVSKDCIFSSPDNEGTGIENFTTHIEEFQEQYLGAYFETLKFIEHHGQSVAEWMMHRKDGSDLLAGTTVAHYGEDGTITHVAGFWKV